MASRTLLLLLFLCCVTGHKLNMELSGEISVMNSSSEEMKRSVLSTLLSNLNVDEECVDMQVDFRSMNESGRESIANYTLFIKQSRCDIVVDILSITKVSELGIISLHVDVDNTVVSEFWRDKMNSILVFSGCGAIVVIVLVTCVVMTTGCYKRDPSKKDPQTYKPSKQNFYHPYAIDTMTLDHRKYSRKENFQTINESEHQEPTTIERWVNSQLSKGRRQSSAINLNHDGRRNANTPKQNSPCEDMLTTDSGIVTTAPRSRYSDLGQKHDRDSKRNKDLTKGNSRTQLLSSPQSYHEPHFRTCNSINYIRHENGAFTHSSSSQDSDSLEESSKL